MKLAPKFCKKANCWQCTELGELEQAQEQIKDLECDLRNNQNKP